MFCNKQVSKFENDKFLMEKKSLKDTAIRQREKDMKKLWGESTTKVLKIPKESPMERSHSDKESEIRYS